MISTKGWDMQKQGNIPGERLRYIREDRLKT